MGDTQDPKAQASLDRGVTADEFAEYVEAYYSVNPRERKQRELVVEYAQEKRGLVEEYLRLRYGDYWASPVILPLNECAARLRTPAKRLKEIEQEMMNDVLPRWRDSKECRDNAGPLVWPDPQDVLTRDRR